MAQPTRADTLDEVTVTATRGADAIVETAVPFDTLSRRDIEATGAARLDDLLSNLAGFAPVHAFGSGVQIQGLGPEYTLILLDGEPIIGRLNGTLDLDRLGVQSVERVEVLRGPFSSLYGADALAGVINLISRTPRERFRGEVTARTQSRGVVDGTTDLSMLLAGLRAGLTVRHFRSGGYDLDPLSPAPTAPAYSGSDVALRLAGPLPLGLTARLSGRMEWEDQRDGTRVSLPPGSAPLTGQGSRTSWSVSGELGRPLARGVRGLLRGYGSQYQTETLLAADDGDTLTSRFTQDYVEGEARLDAAISRAHLLTTGGGVIGERVTADRIGGGRRGAHNVFAYLQHQWLASSRIEATASARLDAHSEHAARVSPAAAVLVRPGRRLTVRASVGSGFKAPTFQQRYLDFTNAAAGYTVVGAVDVEEVLARYESEGAIERYENAGLLGGTLRPETSVAGNVGVTVAPAASISVTVGAFANHVRDLIDIVPVAVLAGGRQVYTYVNLDRVRTSGVELSGDWAPPGPVSASLRYQYLDAVDLGALEDIDAGRVFRRENGVDIAVTRGDYGGLFGRSHHSASGEVRWQTPLSGLGVSVRGVYRSRYGDFDRNGNLILDDPAEYVAGHTLVHSTVTYRLGRWVRLQAGVENAFDYTDPARVPALPGRSWFAALRVARMVP